MNSNNSKWRDSEGYQVIRTNEYDLFTAIVDFAEYSKTHKGNEYIDVQEILLWIEVLLSKRSR